MSRDDELISVFAETLGVFEGLLSHLELSAEETEAFEATVFLWFNRFMRRPGNEQAPVDRFQIPLLAAACKLARDLSVRKGVEVPALSRDPQKIARDLGLFDSPKKGRDA